MKVPAAGGSAVPATRLDTAAGERQHFAPVALEGNGFAFLTQSTGGGPAGRRLAVSTLDASTHRVTDMRVGSNVAIVGSAVVFARGRALLAQPIDREFRLSGEPTTIAPLVRTGSTGIARFSASRTGLIAFTTGNRGTTRMTWVDRRGRDIEVVGEKADYTNPALSPDGKRLAVGIRGANGLRDLWLIDLARGARSRLTTTLPTTSTRCGHPMAAGSISPRVGPATVRCSPWSRSPVPRPNGSGALRRSPPTRPTSVLMDGHSWYPRMPARANWTPGTSGRPVRWGRWGCGAGRPRAVASQL